MDSQEFRRVFMPYCLQRLEDGRYIVLNRHYKPLGIPNGDWVDYETHPSAVEISGLGPKTIQKLSSKGSDDASAIHLYSDSCNPTKGAEHWSAYSERLALMAKLIVS